MTNYEKIKNMSVEEMAKFINELKKQLQAKTDECEEAYQTLEEQVSSCLKFPEDMQEDLSFNELLSQNQETLDIYSKLILDKEQENTALKQGNEILVEALEAILRVKPKVIQTYEPLALMDARLIKGIAKTALDRLSIR